MVEDSFIGMGEPGDFEGDGDPWPMGKRPPGERPEAGVPRKTIRRFRFRSAKDAAELARFIRTHPKRCRWLLYRCLETGDALAVMESAEWFFRGMPGFSLLGLYDTSVQPRDLVEELD